MAYSICTPVLPFVLDDPTEISVLVSAYGFGLLVMSPIIGIISDKLGHRKLLMLVGACVLGAGMVVFALVPIFWVLLVSRVVQGAASGTMWTLGLAIVADKFTDNLGTAMGTVFACYTGGQLIAPTIAGVMYDKLGYPAPFLLVAGLAGIVFILLVLFVEQKSAPQQTTLKEFFGLFKNQPLILIMSMLCVGGVSLAYIDVFLPLHLADNFQYDSTRVGLIMLSFVLPQVLFSPPAGYLYDKVGFRSVFAGFLIIVVAAPIAGYTQEIGGLIGCLVAVAIGSAVASTPFMAEITFCVPKSQYAQSYGLLNLALSIGMFLGPLIGSPIYIQFGWKGIAVTLAILYFLCLPLALWYRRPNLEPSSSELELQP
ncbi:major facilitator superfamily domain-containing protein [Gorgonomyces haynaldii]|nr:major facilitator superfamily domain-containing protein [Gorgonomyces haynaldii]